MLTTQMIECFVQAAKLSGDKDKQTITAKLHITPLTRELAAELKPQIAKQLFHKDGEPVQEQSSTVLNIGKIDLQNIYWFPHNGDGAEKAGVMTPAVHIEKIEAAKLFPDSPKWSLIIHIVMGADTSTLMLCHKYFKKTVHMTFEKSQEELLPPDTIDDSPKACKVCTKPATKQIEGDNQFVCDEHFLDGDTLIRNLPKVSVQ